MTNPATKGKTLPKQNGSRRLNEYKRKQKNSSAFTRSRVAASPKPKVKSSPLKKISKKSKIIKKTSSKPVVKKKSDVKSKEVVELENEIALMNKKIKLAENAQLNAKKDGARSKEKKSKLNDERKSKVGNNSAVKNVSKKPRHTNDLKARRSSKIVVSNNRLSGVKEVLKVKCKRRVPESGKKYNAKQTRSVSAVVSSKTAPKLPIKKASTSKVKAAAAVKGKVKPAVVKVDKSVKSKSKKEINLKLKSKKKSDTKIPVVAKSKSSRKRKIENAEADDGNKVAYIHVGSGEGQRYLSDHLRGSSQVNIQVLSTEHLPDIDYSDMIHGLDHAGTSRDYVDEGHRCTVRCPVGCQGHLRPNELVIYESLRQGGRLLERKRIKGRFVEGDPGDEVVSALRVTDFRRVSGRGRLPERNQRRRMENQRRYRRTMEQDRNDSPILPVPTRIGVPTGLPQRVGILMDTPPVSREVAEEHSWNINDRSFNVVLKQDDPLTMRRHPVAQSTDCIRGKVGYNSGLHLWEVTWPIRQRGTHAVVGVATREAVLHCVGYQSLVGNTDHSWGWDLGRKKAYHNSTVNGGTNYPPSITHHHQWTVPDRFFMVLDMDIGNLGFAFGDQFLGWSHTGIKTGERVFPIVSTVWGHCEVKLAYRGELEGGVVGLKELSRNVIRKSLSRDAAEFSAELDKLGLPTRLRKYLKYEW